MSELQFPIGSFVVYDTYGVCKISEVKRITFSRDRAKENYYILSPLNSFNSTYYVPLAHSEEKLRLPMTKQEIDSLLSEMTLEDMDWIDNRQMRADSFKKILSNGIGTQLMELIRCIYAHRSSLEDNGKNLSSSDDMTLSSAEKLVNEEFAFSLGIEPDEVANYISDFLREKEA